MKKCIILSMGCNNYFYNKEEEFIKNTWGKDIYEKENGLDLYFYKGNNENNIIDEEKKEILLKNEDDLKHSYSKTIAAFKKVLEEKDFDYIIKTNTTTFINPILVEELINSEYLEEDKIYGGRLIITSDNIFFPFFRGNFILISKKIVNEIVESYTGTMDGVDDNLLFLEVTKQKWGGNYTKKLKEIDSINDLNEPYFNMFKNALYVRNKTITIDLTNRENYIIFLLGIYSLYKAIKEQFVLTKPHDITKIETFYGVIN